ncbi:hypothetical protein [Curtobacterium sp. HSID17257]|uniref:hypothetical protein n=1 Tax=Curtobacterium sp. HSID17257 TaxID=2419510 RepID=UPI000F892A38|nr:hypothetical protein [Curtobacterium sp. HSID17257]
MDWFAPVLTAISAVVVALIAALIADRTTLRRLERVDGLLRESGLTGEHRKVLEDVRARLVERIAYRELRPVLRRFSSLAWLLTVSGPVLVASWGIDLARATDGKEPEFPGFLSGLVLAMGVGMIVGAFYLFVSLSAERQVWAMQTLPSRRDELAELDLESTDEGA